MISTLGALGAALALGGCGDNLEPPTPPTPTPESTCNESGQACTWLGMPGQTGFNKDGHDRLSTMIYWSMDMLFAKDGSVWFIDWNSHLVRRIMPDGKIASVVGWSDPVFPGDGDAAHPMAELSAEGAIGSDVQLNHPTDLVEAADGSILLMAWHNHKIRRIDPKTNRSFIVAGAGPGFVGDNGPLSKALFKQASRLALDEQQNLYVLDQQNQRVRKVDAQTQVIKTIAGNGKQGYGGDGGPAIDAMLNFEVGANPEPSGGMVASRGALYLADTENSRIRKVDLETGMITTLAGTGSPGYSGDDGPAASAQLYHPRDLEIGPEGDLYVADTDNGRIRAINLTTGVIRTVVGTGELGLDEDDDRPATETKLNRPFGVDFDREGNLYVSDSINSRILRVAR